jgi:hypothetical protein
VNCECGEREDKPPAVGAIMCYRGSPPMQAFILTLRSSQVRSCCGNGCPSSTLVGKPRTPLESVACLFDLVRRLPPIDTPAALAVWFPPHPAARARHRTRSAVVTRPAPGPRSSRSYAATWSPRHVTCCHGGWLASPCWLLPSPWPHAWPLLGLASPGPSRTGRSSRTRTLTRWRGPGGRGTMRVCVQPTCVWLSELVSDSQ